jgi:stearoyl-CoA desaturase (delta-9 desaturase)
MSQTAETSDAVLDQGDALPAGACPDRLEYPETVDPKSINWIYLIPIASIHALSLFVLLPWLFSWTGVILCVLGIHFFGQGITICYHRLLTHRSFKVPTWLERAWVVVAICNLEDTPAKWVSTHRIHHIHSDRRPDPHSPLVNFLWSHMEWLFKENSQRRNAEVYHRFAHDVMQDRFFFTLEKFPFAHFYIYVAHAVLFFLVGLATGWALEGTAMAGLQFGLSILVWGVLLRTVIVWHITWTVNSLSHVFGYQTYETKDQSRNNWFVSLISVGEGWHNNHHYDQSSASNHHRWWELDISYYEIKLLEKLGLAWDVIPPHFERKRRAATGRAAAKAGE